VEHVLYATSLPSHGEHCIDEALTLFNEVAAEETAATEHRVAAEQLRLHVKRFWPDDGALAEGAARVGVARLLLSKAPPPVAALTDLLQDPIARRVPLSRDGSWTRDYRAGSASRTVDRFVAEAHALSACLVSDHVIVLGPRAPPS
jgi:hypothetical protein